MKKLILIILIASMGFCQNEVKEFNYQLKKEIKLKYLIYLPNNYSEKDKYPLVLFLHGSGERGSDINKVKKHGLPKLIEEGKQFPFIIISPQCPENKIWNNLTEELYLLIKDVTNKYSVDDKKIYCTGLSMGGFGTWALAIAYPDLFAAIAPVCGGAISFQAPILKHLPIWAFHGYKDQAVPIAYQQMMVDALINLNANIKFTVYKNYGHNIWDTTYNRQDLYDWLLSNSK
jgi:predicted peptidase